MGAPRFVRFWLVFLAGLVGAAHLQAEGLEQSDARFYYLNRWGMMSSAPIIRHYWRRPVVHPAARIDPRIDPRLRRAATIAEERANAHTKALCWQYVKKALLAAGAVDSYPQTVYATQAGEELTRKYGFTKLPIHDPYAAPVGAVIVYGGRGHVEIRTPDGFASDYHSRNRCFYPVMAVYGKFSSSLAKL